MVVTTETRTDPQATLPPEVLDLEVLAQVTAARGSIRGTTVARRSRRSVVDVFVALARLCNAGQIERTAPGQYRPATDSTD